MIKRKERGKGEIGDSIGERTSEMIAWKRGESGRTQRMDESWSARNGERRKQREERRGKVAGESRSDERTQKERERRAERREKSERKDERRDG